MNYVQVWVEGDRHCVKLFDRNPLNRTIGLAVNSEFSSRCEIRKQIYRDLVRFIESQDYESEDDENIHPIFNFEIVDSDYSSHSLEDSDIQHVRSLQMKFANIDDDDKLTKLRKYVRAVNARRREVNQRITVCPEPHDSELVDDIFDIIQNYQDSKVIGQCVAWKQSNKAEPGDFETFVTLDESDIIGNGEAINNAIKNRLSADLALEIVHPRDISV